MKFIIAIVGAIGIYFLLAFNPQWYFSQKIEKENIILFHNFSETYDFNSVIESLSYVLKKSKLYREEYKFKICLSKDRREYYFYAPLCCNKRYCLNPFINIVYISPIYVNNNKLEFVNNFKYEFINEIKKAAVYSLILQSIPVLSYLTIKDWRKTGYSEYIADNIPFYTDIDLCNPPQEKDFREFENKMVVKYMIEEMHLGEDEIFSGNYAYEGILKDVKMKYCKK